MVALHHSYLQLYVLCGWCDCCEGVLAECTVICGCHGMVEAKPSHHTAVGSLRQPVTRLIGPWLQHHQDMLLACRVTAHMIAASLCKSFDLLCLVPMQYIIPYLLGFDEIFQFDSGADAGQPEAFGADWSRPPSAEPPVPMPTSAPF